jgi:hypothetical protein
VGTDAANKSYVDTSVSGAGFVTLATLEGMKLVVQQIGNIINCVAGTTVLHTISNSTTGVWNGGGWSPASTSGNTICHVPFNFAANSVVTIVVSGTGASNNGLKGTGSCTIYHNGTVLTTGSWSGNTFSFTQNVTVQPGDSFQVVDSIATDPNVGTYDSSSSFSFNIQGTVSGLTGVLDASNVASYGWP